MAIMENTSDLSMSPRYTEWLRYVFDRPVTPNAWFFDLDVEPFDAGPCELAGLIVATFEHCGRDLAPYSDEQLSHGISFILDNSSSDCVFALMSEDVPLALRLRAIASLEKLYSDIFEPRCAPVLGHLDEDGGNAMNTVCYMLWDASPLSCWERSKEKAVFYGAVADVLDHALRSPNRACVESALHGLGHIHLYHSCRVEQIVDAFLEHGVRRFPELRRYAQRARKGQVL